MDTESPNHSISEDGAYIVDDPGIGRMVATFASKGYRFQTADGLAFLRAVMEDKRVDSAVTSLERPGLGMFKVFGPHSGTARALLNRTTNERLALTVLLCRNNSRVSLHQGTQKIELDAKPGETGLLELPYEDLDKPNITRKEVVMEQGGLIIADGRLFFTVLDGVALAVGFAAEKELKEWGQMPLPKSDHLEQMVEAMDSERIRMNFKFVTVTVKRPR